LGGAVVGGCGGEAVEGHACGGDDGVGAPCCGVRAGVAEVAVEEGLGAGGPADEEGEVVLAEADLEAVVHLLAGVDTFAGGVEGENVRRGWLVSDDHASGVVEADGAAVGEKRG